MKVILNSDVTNLGEEGDICAVAPGYARNYLLPKGLVMMYNEQNLARIEERRAEIEERRTIKRKEAASIKERIETEPLVISMTAGINGKLFGSVTASTIVEQLVSKGIELERKRIEVPEHSLKSVGTYKLRIKLYADQEAILTVKVEAANARELEEKRVRLGGAKAPDAAPEAAPEVDESDDESEPVAEADSEVSTDPEIIAMQQAVAEEEAAEEEEVATAEDEVAAAVEAEAAAVVEEAVPEEAAPEEETESEGEPTERSGE